MIESDATPKEIVEWFRSDYCRDEVLLLWISAEQNHQKILQQIVQDVPALDTILQDIVAFILVSANSEPTVIRSGIGLRHAPFFRRINRIEYKHTKSFTNNIIRATISSASDFATFFKIDAKEIPSLLVLFKESDDCIVCPLGFNFSLVKLRPWLAKIVAAARQHRNNCNNIPPDDRVFQLSLQKVSDANQTLVAKQRQIRETLTAYLYSHPSTEKFLEALSAITIKKDNFSAKDALQILDFAISKIETQENKKPLLDGRLQKIRKILLFVSNLQTEIDGWLEIRPSIQARFEAYQNSSKELHAQIRRIRFELAGSRLATLSRSTEYILSATPRWLDLCSRFLEASSKLLDKVLPFIEKT